MSAKRSQETAYSLYLVADAAYAGNRDLVRLVREAVRGGVTAVQLRAKGLGTREFLKLAIRMADVLKSRSIPFIINDRVDIALACGADGVHLGQDDMPADKARKLLGRTKIIGISVNTMKEARAAERLGADYIGLNPVYETATKNTGLPAVGPGGVARMHERIGIPIIAIGGIDTGNAAGIMRAGAAGVAVISAILGSPDVRKAAAELKKVLSADLPSRGRSASSGGMSPGPSKATL